MLTVNHLLITPLLIVRQALSVQDNYRLLVFIITRYIKSIISVTICESHSERRRSFDVTCIFN